MARKKQDQEKADADLVKEKNAVSDYRRLMGEVVLLKTISDTLAWRKLYSWIRREIANHSALLLTAEKTREIIQHQEGVKILEALIHEIRRPVTALHDFQKKMPLFDAKEGASDVQFDDVTGAVTITPCPPKQAQEKSNE